MRTIIIRRAVPSDACSLARIHVDTWRSTYQGIISEDHLKQISYEKSEARWRRALNESHDDSFVQVAEVDDGILVGFASGGVNRDEYPGYDGELYAIYLLKEFQREGIGQLLMSSIAGELLERQMKSMMVWVLASNSAKGFYKYLGGKLIDTRLVRIGDEEYEEYGYGWGDIEPLIFSLSTPTATK
jgi:GNAT superfamily N-acetyltransferase